MIIFCADDIILFFLNVFQNITFLSKCEALCASTIHAHLHHPNIPLIITDFQPITAMYHYSLQSVFSLVVQDRCARNDVRNEPDRLSTLMFPQTVARIDGIAELCNQCLLSVPQGGFLVEGPRCQL